jgi:hypothetical protein
MADTTPTVVDFPTFDVSDPLLATTPRNGIAATQINGSTEIRKGTIYADALVVGSKNFTHNIAWTAVDYNTASWGAGTLYLADGSSKAIVAGDTGNISARTYIYFDTTDTLKTTTVLTDAIGSSKLLLAIVEASSDTAGFTIITALGSTGTTIDGDKIVTGRIQSSDGKTYFDLDEGQIIINDGYSDRILIGKQVGGF